MKLTFKSTLLFGIGFAVLLGLQFYFILNSYRLEEKELLRQGREIAMEVMDQINTERQLNEDEKSEQHWLQKSDLNNYTTNSVYPFDQQEELSSRIDSILSAKTAKSKLKIDLKHEIYSILDLEKNVEKLPKGKTLIFYKSSGDILKGNTIVEGKWTSKHLNSNTETAESIKTSHYIRSRSLFELKNINQLLLIQILPLSLVSAAILILLLMLFYKNQKIIQLKQAQIKRLHTTIDNIAHELNTPLATMKFHLATTKNSDSKALLQRQIGKLEHVVKSIHHETKESELATKESVTNFLEHWQEQHSNIVFNRDVTGIKNNVLREEEIQIILSNLLENAVKYGGTIIDTFIHFEDALTIQVSDNGIGIPVNERAMVFEKFYRVLQNNEASNHGLGVGLHIVKQIVSARRGNITLNENTPKGTTLTITIPNED